VPSGVVYSGTNSLFLVRDGEEILRREGVIPASVQAEGFNHIGDVAFDGRLLLPLECYSPLGGGPLPGDPANTCGRGAIGVVDVATLSWSFHVRLDPAEIPKAMWLATGPGGLVWTQSGLDLLAYRSADIVPGSGAPIRAVQRFAGVLPGQMTGGAVLDGRLWMARQDQLWSVDLAGGVARGEQVLVTGGEAEGLEAFEGFGGRLHWLIASGEPLPVRGTHWSWALHLFDGPGSARRSAIRLRVRRSRVRAGRVRLRVRASTVVVGRREAVVGASVRAGGRRTSTDGSGRAVLRVRARRRIVVRATSQRLRPGRTVVRTTR
jgi:hypothetical protein